VRESAPEPARAEPPPPAEPVVKPAPAPEVSVPSKADIALKAKKEQEAKQQEAKRRREQEEQAAREMKAREEEKRLDAKRFDAKRLDAKRQADAEKQRTADEAKQRAEADRLRAEADAKATAAQAARDKAISDYTGRIAALIRSRANIPDNVTGQPVIQLRVRLLTNGNVFEATVANPSGNRAYDEAVERAINGIRQWPVPDNPEILGRQRELLLKITHER
jgi:colicin import membrane protein